MTTEEVSVAEVRRFICCCAFMIKGKVSNSVKDLAVLTSLRLFRGTNREQ